MDDPIVHVAAREAFANGELDWEGDSIRFMLLKGTLPASDVVAAADSPSDVVALSGVDELTDGTAVRKTLSGNAVTRNGAAFCEGDAVSWNPLSGSEVVSGVHCYKFVSDDSDSVSIATFPIDDWTADGSSFTIGGQAGVGYVSFQTTIVPPAPFPTSDWAHRWVADEIAGLSSSDPISTWPDVIGSADLTGASTVRPLWTPNEVNGHAVARFDGTNDVLRNASVSIPNGRGTFVVARLRTVKAGGSQNVIMSASPASPAARLRTRTQTDGNFWVGGSANNLLSAVPPDTNWHLLVNIGGAGYLALDRSPIIAGDAGATDATRIALGWRDDNSSDWSEVDIAEAGVSAVQYPDIGALRDYVRQTYAIL